MNIELHGSTHAVNQLREAACILHDKLGRNIEGLQISVLPNSDTHWSATPFIRAYSDQTTDFNKLRKVVDEQITALGRLLGRDDGHDLVVECIKLHICYAL